MRALIFLLISGLAVAALLWCLAGFSRALKQPRKVIGLFVQRSEAGQKQACKTRIQKGKFVIERLQMDDQAAHITMHFSIKPDGQAGTARQEAWKSPSGEIDS